MHGVIGLIIKMDNEASEYRRPGRSENNGRGTQTRIRKGTYAGWMDYRGLLMINEYNKNMERIKRLKSGKRKKRTLCAYSDI